MFRTKTVSGIGKIARLDDQNSLQASHSVSKREV